MFHYDPATGKVTWLVAKRYGIKVGDEAGWLGEKGYLYLKVDGVQALAHCFIWCMQTGEWPSHGIDHYDLDRLNNSWSNLRAASDAQQMQNKHVRVDNKIGLKGVSWSRIAAKYIAQIQVNGSKRHLGYFDCPAAAHFAYIIAAGIAFGEFSRTE